MPSENCKYFTHILLTPNSLKLYFHYTLCQHLLPMHNISYIVFKYLNKGKSHPLHNSTNSFLLHTCTHALLRVEPFYSLFTDRTQLCFFELIANFAPFARLPAYSQPCKIAIIVLVTRCDIFVHCYKESMMIVT